MAMVKILRKRDVKDGVRTLVKWCENSLWSELEADLGAERTVANQNAMMESPRTQNVGLDACSITYGFRSRLRIFICVRSSRRYVKWQSLIDRGGLERNKGVGNANSEKYAGCWFVITQCGYCMRLGMGSCY